MSPIAHSNPDLSQRCFYAVRWILGASLILISPAIAPSTWADQPPVQDMQLAQAQFTLDQLPLSHLSDARSLAYGDRITGTLNVGSLRHEGRRFAIYQFEGEVGQLARVTLGGGLAGQQPSNQVQTGTLLVNPIVILLDPNGQIIAQQPQQSDVAFGIIRMNLPMTGTYSIFVTSGTYGAGGRYTLGVEQLTPEN